MGAAFDTMPDDLSDDYVADLLKKDAKSKSKDYSFVGLSAFLPKRPTTQAPKPNLKFLRNILKETDSHNTALKEKEEGDSRNRLKALRKNTWEEKVDVARRQRDRNEERPSKRRRMVEREAHDDRDRRRYEEGRSKNSHSVHERSKRVRRSDSWDGDESETENRRHKNSRERHRSRRHHERSRERHHSDSEGDKRSHKRHGNHESRSQSRSRSSSRQEYRKGHRRRRSRSPLRNGKKCSSKRNHDEKPTTSPRDADSDSDPLEAIVGPLRAPPPPQPHRRGRGIHASASAMDARFSASYDPSADMEPDSDNEQDDWGLALERLRDRAKWKALGAERLKGAGFSDAEVKKWEKSDREKGEEDVTWAKKGEGREWDRGKFVDRETGEVELRAEWGRLE